MRRGRSAFGEKREVLLVRREGGVLLVRRDGGVLLVRRGRSAFGKERSAFGEERGRSEVL